MVYLILESGLTGSPQMNLMVRNFMVMMIREPGLRIGTQRMASWIPPARHRGMTIEHEKSKDSGCFWQLESF